jgi:hypothetical protein
MNSSRSHLPSLLSALLFIVAALLFFSIALLMGVTALGTFFAGKDVGAQQTILLVVSAFEALILLGATFVAFQRFVNKPFAEQDSSFNIPTWLIVTAMFVAGLSLLLGYQIVESGTANWLLLPILTLPAVVLPIFVVLGLGIHKLPLGTRWQSWNVFGLAMTLSPFILIFLEVIALTVIVLIVILILMTQPGFEAQIQRLSQQMLVLDPQSMAAQRLVAPYLVKPKVIAVALLYFAMVVPILEEIFKPLGVWFFANKLTSPAQGFALGALSGSAYALVETFGVSAQTADWATLLLSRIGTGALHITTSALMGAGIVYAIRERRYLRLLGIYFLSVSLHGLWNALAIFFAFSNIANYFELESPFRDIDTSLNVAMAFLVVLLLVILVLSNRRIKSTVPIVAAEESLPQAEFPSQ